MAAEEDPLPRYAVSLSWRGDAQFE